VGQLLGVLEELDERAANRVGDALEEDS
jgi:hypothetical protein